MQPDVAPSGSCPSEDVLAEFVAGSACDRDREALERHIDVCGRCAATLAMFGGAYGSASDAPSQLDTTRPSLPGPAPVNGARFAGRYLIRECVGFGAGGTVYAAYDPELERVVALKLLRAGVGTGGSTRPDQRWTREAKVMARVVHPNVVTVHDVGATDDFVFIATEFIEGSNLERWLVAREHAWTEVHALFVDAGRGLAAIHDAGLVHRDFKPHNVMVGHDPHGAPASRRVCVTDFGLARTRPDLDETGEELEIDPELVLSDGMLAATMATRTRTGTIVGTPGYMSPEQWHGKLADARSDQFSFCVALYEALFGRRPFAGRTAADLSASVCEGHPRVPAAGKTPRWLVRAVMRGLARAPEDRFPDMHALLAALTEAPRRVRHRRVTAALAFGFAGVLVVGYGLASMPVDECRKEDRRLAGLWNDARRTEVRDALVDAPAGVATEVESTVDDWIARWRTTHDQACDDRSRNELASERQHELRLVCLDRRVSELQAALDVLRDRTAADHALAVVGTASDPARCFDVDTLETLEPAWSGPLARHLFQEMLPEIDRIEALRAAGRLDEALAAAEAAVVRADADGDHAVRAEAHVALGQVQSARKEPTAAETSLRAGVWAAEASGHVDAAATAWVELVNVLGAQQERFAEAREAGERAGAVVYRLHDAERELQLASNLAVLESMDGRYEEALVLQQDLLARAFEVYGEDHYQVSRMHMNMAAVLSHLGRVEEALEHARLGIAKHERLYPGAHPVTAEMYNTAGALELQLGRLPEGRVTLERALAIAEETLPSQDLTIATVTSNLAQLELMEKRYDDARARYTRVLEIQRAVHGPSHPDVALALHNLAGVMDESGDPSGALALYRESLAIRVATSGPDHPGTANTRHNYGRVLARLGRLDEGIAEMEQALVVRERAKVDPFKRASSHWGLGRALWERGDQALGLDHIHRARDLLRGIAPRHAEHLAKMEAWLAERESPRPRK
jgi:eukaryotic-like serine/threonine-protein kinase